MCYIKNMFMIALVVNKYLMMTYLPLLVLLAGGVGGTGPVSLSATGMHRAGYDWVSEHVYLFYRESNIYTILPNII